MKVVNAQQFENTELDVQFTGGHSCRMATQSDGLGFSVNKTFVPKSDIAHVWHYKNHKEACYCISGEGVVTDVETNEEWKIVPGSMYMLPNNEKMTFLALTDVVMISIFNPPLTGKETHGKDGSYEYNQQMRIRDLTSDLREEIDSIENVNEKIDALNYARTELHSVSPLNHHPVDCVLWVKSEDVEANEYNPNAVAPPEMQLLYESIKNDGYTMPIVAFREPDKIMIVDGFHRRETEKRNADISESTLGYLPISSIRESQKDTSDRMASTIRHNRARGSHNIELMSQIVSELVEMGKGDYWICKHVGMSIDELLRMKQITGLASLFTNKDFSEAWEVGELD